ncbi:ATP-binding protein [Nocardia brasiliensis]|uniref:ATP-binding protein n=1 Tax=Nocardia brasiliensis TaxID=37326 RepID=UPI001895D966|nr:tetratricopeptide repeat protein [Nocardia brasiliensis]MBF6126596.1 tetratricopeptide repeat protein [Nocardia brasiliensis]
MQLPPDTDDFAGREEQITRLTSILSADPSRKAVPIATICGQPGVGKTALAIHVAHHVSEAFPDGQLYANLRGAEPLALDAGEVVAGFLRELGVDGAEIPEGTDERARVYRTHLAGRRVIVVLDNAANETQIRPLLPGSASCAVLVTSRSHMAALSGSNTIHLDVLSPDHATALLASLVGAQRARAEPQAVQAVARLCGYLPLALRIAGARLMSRPAWTISWFAERLADESRRLDLLKAGDLEVRASFALSYQSRNSAEQRAFRILTLTAASFPAWNIAALLDLELDEAEELLERLVDAQLVEVAGSDPVGQIRYRLHDLIRDFARECCANLDTSEVRREAVKRLVGKYTVAVRIASATLHPGLYGEEIIDPIALIPTSLARGNPRGWFIAERANLIAAVDLAHDAELWPPTWQLVETLSTVFDWRADWQAWAHTHNLASDAARRAANEHAEAVILRSWGALYRELGRFSDAVDILTQATEIFWRIGELRRWATAMRSLGDTRRYQGRLDDAIIAFSAALDIFEAESDTRSVAGVLNGIADASRGLCRWADARERFEASLNIYRELNDELEEARTLVRYGLVDRDLWRNTEAACMFTKALKVFRRLEDQRWEARALRHIAITHRNEGDIQKALAVFDECLSIFERLADRRGVGVTLRNRGDTHRLANNRSDAAADLQSALQIFRDIGDDRWTARTQLSMADLNRRGEQWSLAEQSIEPALATFRSIGDRPAEARTLRELGLLRRDLGEFEAADKAFIDSCAIFMDLGDDLWVARVKASHARMVARRGEDPSPLMDAAVAICHRHNIVTPDSVDTVLQEW